MEEDLFGGRPADAVDRRRRTGGLHDAAALQERGETGVVLVHEGQVVVQGAGQALGQRAGPGYGEALVQPVGRRAQGGLVELLLAAREVAVDQGA